MRSQVQNGDSRKHRDHCGNECRPAKPGRYGSRFVGVTGLVRQRSGRFGPSLVDIVERAAERWVNLETALRKSGKGLRDRFWHNRFSICCSIPYGWLLGQRFDQGDAERPDVRRRRNPLAGDLGRVINLERPKFFVNLAHELKAVPGNFQLIADDHNVRRFQMTMHETLSVKIEKRVEDRGEHLLGLTGREGSLVRIISERTSSASSVTE